MSLNILRYRYFKNSIIIIIIIMSGYINVLHILNRKVLQKEISYFRSVAPIRLYYESIDASGKEENGSEMKANISQNNCFRKKVFIIFKLRMRFSYVKAYI